ncbi:MAG: hypothetical protein KQA36_01900 [Candidatus Aenigmarchaeota archaeon]|nr:hypothetical protein [Candidatus Aenigmarchaeota archaeon]
MILTFEKIRELQWNEKNSKNLQELPKNFFQDAKEYLARTKDSYSRFVIEDLVDMRIRKILNFAINYFKTKEIPKNMTVEERELFESILSYVSNFRKNYIESELQPEEKNIKNEKLKEDESKKIKAIVVERDIGPFVGTDLKIYNLKKGEKVILPEDLKNLLIKYGYCKIEEE